MSKHHDYIYPYEAALTLAEKPSTVKLLTGLSHTSQAYNHKLKKLAKKLGFDALFVIDSQAIVVAHTEETVIGANFSSHVNIRTTLNSGEGVQAAIITHYYPQVHHQIVTTFPVVRGPLKNYYWSSSSRHFFA